MANLLLPPILVGPFRAALQVAGYSPNIVTDEGSVDPGQLVASAYDTIEFRSRIFPSLAFSTASLIGGGPTGGGLAELLKPSVILTGRSGKVEVAPYGTPDPATGLFGFILFAGTLISIGYLVGRAGKA